MRKPMKAVPMVRVSKELYDNMEAALLKSGHEIYETLDRVTYYANQDQHRTKDGTLDALDLVIKAFNLSGYEDIPTTQTVEVPVYNYQGYSYLREKREITTVNRGAERLRKDLIAAKTAVDSSAALDRIKNALSTANTKETPKK